MEPASPLSVFFEMGNLCPLGTIYLLYILFVASTCECEYFRSNTAFGVGVIRERRQAGYVYDRPSKSFNLPSRAIIGSTSSQATNVDRTSAQQMYYAYPVPAGGSSVRTGYSSASATAAGSSSTSETEGYKYNSAVVNTATASAGGITSTISIGPGSTGYTYSDAKQDNVLDSVAGTTTGTGSTGYNGTGSTGYNYSGGTKNTASVVGGTVIANTGTVGVQEGSEGYRQSGIVQKTDSGSIEGSAVSASLGSVSSGYKYSGAAQNSLSGSSGTINTVTTGVGSSSTGYNYDTQNIGNRDTQTVTSFVPLLYNTPSSGSQSTVSVEPSSTNAPQYLPPTSGSNGDVSITTNTNSNSVSQIVKPSDKYLPPVENTQFVTQTGNVPSVKVAMEISNGPTPIPSISYLQPNAQQETYNAPISEPIAGYLQPHTQKQISKMPIADSIQGLKEDYLPPVLNTGTVTAASVSKPAATYLPPVF